MRASASRAGAILRAAGPGIASRVRLRVQDWFHSRQPRTDTLLLTQRNVYILPTRAGWLFAVTLAVLLVASINYQLNLGYLLTFLLAGSGVVSMHLTHAALRGLTLRLKPVAPVFAGEPAALDVVFTSPGAARYGIGVRLADSSDALLTWIDVPALGQAQAHVSFVPGLRGFHAGPALVATTRFPLGLFRAWSVWRPATLLLVYPALERPAATLPAVRSVTGGASAARRNDGGEIEGVRAYRRGDPLKMIAWKKAAKALDTGGDLVSRDAASAAHQELWLEWQACAGLPSEERLSRLAAWVVAAHRAGVDFGLRLAATEIAPATGDAHRRRCLEALATWR